MQVKKDLFTSRKLDNPRKISEDAPLAIKMCPRN
jgi:hypothetical protein